MADAIEVREIAGAQTLEGLGKDLKAAGAGELKKELLRGIRAANKPTIALIRANARATLPSRGGLAALIAKSTIGTRTNVGGKNVGIRITAKNRIGLSQLNAGRLRHPVFGNRDTWVQQSVPAGWFEDPIKDQRAAIQREITNVMRDVARKIEGA